LREEVVSAMRRETMPERLASLDEMGRVAAFLASERAGSMIAAFANITCGAVLDYSGSIDHNRTRGDIMTLRRSTAQCSAGTPKRSKPGEGVVTMWRLPGYVGGEPGQPVSREVVAVMVTSGDRSSDVLPHWSVDFWVHDVDVIADKAAKLGGRIVSIPL
jgi:hypothetical protein